MRLDPRTKLLILAVTSVSVFVNKSIAVECVLAGIPLVLLSVSGNLKRMLKYAAFFLALLLIQLFIVGTVFQNPRTQFFNTDTDSEIVFGLENRGIPREALRSRLDELTEELHLKERHPLSLSGGQMQRLAVVVSDICGKELLVFDEPTSGLDLKSMEEVGTLTRSLATQGKVLLIITHDIEFMMRICTRILFIRDGEIVEDLSGGQKEKIVRLLRGEE